MPNLWWNIVLYMSQSTFKLAQGIESCIDLRLSFYVCMNITHWNAIINLYARVHNLGVWHPLSYHLIAMCMVILCVHIGHSKMASCTRATSPYKECSRADVRKHKVTQLMKRSREWREKKTVCDSKVPTYVSQLQIRAWTYRYTDRVQ